VTIAVGVGFGSGDIPRAIGFQNIPEGLSIGFSVISLDEMKILLALIEHGGKAESVKSVIKWCGDNPSNPAIKNRYSRLISKLIAKEFITEEQSTRTKRIKLTGFGKVFAKALKLIAISPPTKEVKPEFTYELNYEFNDTLTSRDILKNISLEDIYGKMISSRNEFTNLLARLAKEFKELEM